MQKTLGALYWTIAGPLFLAGNVIVGLAWDHPPYSWATANISDLGNVTCGIWDTSRRRLVCSPWHTSMNVVILLTAALLAAVSGLAGPARPIAAPAHFPRVRLSRLLPGRRQRERPCSGRTAHHGVRQCRADRGGRAAFGMAAGIHRRDGTDRDRRNGALLQQGLGIGVGGMERVAVFPLLIWTTVVGIHWLRGRAIVALA